MYRVYIQKIKMASSLTNVHKLGFGAPSTTANEDKHIRNYLVDLRMIKFLASNTSNPNTSGPFPKISLGEDTKDLSDGTDQVYASEYQTTNTIGSSPYNSNLVWGMATTLESGSPRAISLFPANTGTGDGSTNYGDWVANQYRIRIDQFIPQDINANNVGTDGIILVNILPMTTGTSATDTLIINDPGSEQWNNPSFIFHPGVFFFSLFYGFDATGVIDSNIFSLCWPKITKNFALENGPGNAGSTLCNLISLDRNLDPGEPEEYEGGCIYRVCAQSTTCGQKSDNPSSYIAMLLVYRVDPATQTFSYPSTITQSSMPMSHTVHPMATNGVINGQILGNASTSNYFLVPGSLTVDQFQKLAGFGSLQTSTHSGTDYFRQTPKYSLQPDTYPVNWSQISGALMSSLANVFAYYPYAVFSAQTFGTPLNDITTHSAFFTIFSYNTQPVKVFINGLQVGAQTSINQFAGNTPSIPVFQGVAVSLPQPVNMLRVIFRDTIANTDVVSEVVIRVLADGTSPTTNAYFDSGVFYQESTLQASEEEHYSYCESFLNANVGYLDSYGNYVTPGTNGGTVIAGRKRETLSIGKDDVILFGKTQGFWQQPTSSVVGFTSLAGPSSTTGQIEFDNEGFVRTSSASVGQYTIFPITSRGHVQLTLNVIDASSQASIPTEFTFTTMIQQPDGTYAAPINLSGSTFFNGTTGTYGTPGNDTYIANSILFTKRTIRFSVDKFVFNITVISALTSYPLYIKVAKGDNYNLATLTEIDTKIDVSQLYGTSTAPADNSKPPNNFSWSQAGNAGNNIFLGSNGSLDNVGNSDDVLIAVVTVVDVPAINVSTIITRVGDKNTLWDYIKPFTDGSILVSVRDNSGDGTGISSQQDGTIVINNASTTTFTANVIMMGIVFSLPVNVIILDSTALVQYMTRGAKFYLPTTQDKIDLTTNKGQRVTLTVNDLTTQPYKGSDVEISYKNDTNPSFTGFVFANVRKSCVFVVATGSNPAAQEYNLNPFGHLSTKDQYAELDSSDGSLTLSSFPPGPEYHLFSGLTDIDVFYGGTYTIPSSKIAGANDLVVKVPEYIDSTLTGTAATNYVYNELAIPLHVVQGTHKRIFVVEKRTISGISAIIGNIPSFVSPNPFTGSSITVSRTATASSTDSILVQESSGAYILYEFEFLPMVQSPQTLLFTAGQTYGDILPSYGFDYGSQPLTATLTAPVADLSAGYGELTIVFKFRLYGGRSATQKIYLTASITASEIYPVDPTGTTFQGSKPISLPYSSPTGLLIQPDANNINNIQFVKANPNVPVGEWFLTTASSQTSVLYTFENVPVFNHTDVIIYDTTSGDNDWTADGDSNVFYQVSASDPSVANYPNPFGVNKTLKVFSFVSPDKHVTVDANYYGEVIPEAFTISLESGSQHLVNIVSKFTDNSTIVGTISAYGQDITQMTPYINNARIKTTNARITLSSSSSGNVITFENDKPNSNDGERSTLYVKTSSSLYIFEVFTHNIPYEGTLLIEAYDDDMTANGGFYTFSPFDDNVMNISTSPTLTVTGANNNQVQFVTAGEYKLAYEYYDYTSPSLTSTSPFTVLFSVIKKPKASPSFLILAIGEKLSFNAIEALFGTAQTTHRLDSVLIPGNIPLALASSPVSGDFQSNGSVSLTAQTANQTYVITFNVSVNPSRIGSVEAPAVLSRSKHIKLSDVLITGVITFQTYDPANVPQFILNAFTGASASTYDLTTGPDNVGTTLKYIEYNGQKLDILTTTTINGLTWNNGLTVVSLQSNTSAVNNYFFATEEKGVSLITTVVLPAGPAPLTLKKAQLTSEPVETDLLALFFPQLETQLLDAGLGCDPPANPPTGASDYTKWQLSGFANPVVSSTTVIYQVNGITLSTLRLNLLLVSTPVSPGSLSFTIPIANSFHLSNADVNVTSRLIGGANATAPQYSLTLDPSAFNTAGSDTALYAQTDITGDGIDVEFANPGTYSIGCLLSNADTATLQIAILFVAYDPARTISYNLDSYSGKDKQTLPSALESYSVDGVNFGTTSTQHCLIDNTIPSSPTVTISTSESNPRRVFIFTLKTATTDVDSVAKNVIIYNFTRIQVISTQRGPIYLAKGEQLILSASAFANSSPTAQIAFDNSPYPTTLQGVNIINNSGQVVGYVSAYFSPTSPGPSITLVGNEPGDWDNFVIDIVDTDTRLNTTDNSSINVGQPVPIPISALITTLQSLILTTLPVFVFPIKTAFYVDLNQYIVNKMDCTFTNWTANSLPVSPTIFDENAESTGVISGTTPNSVTTAGSYLFTGTVTSQRHSGLTTSFSVQVVFYDPSNTTSRQAFVDGVNPTTLAFPTTVVRIADKILDATPYIDGHFSFQIDQTTTTNLIITPLAPQTNESVYNLVLSGGDNILLTIQPSEVTNDVTIASLSYSGSLFSANSSKQVVSYFIQGDSTVYSPDISYALPKGGSALIKSNGQYTISSQVALVLNVTYRNPSGSVKITVQANSANTVNVEQPSYSIPLPTGTDIILVNGSPLTQTTPLQLTYATFTWIASSLNIDGISGTFQQTTVQLEVDSGNKVQILEYTLVLAKGIGAIKTLSIPTNSEASFNIGFIPIAVIYDGDVIKGSSASSDIIAEQIKIGNFSFDGQILSLKSGAKSGFSRVLGFTRTDKTTVYFRLQFDSTIQSISIINGQTVRVSDLLGSNINPLPSIAVAGDDNKEQVFPTSSTPGKLGGVSTNPYVTVRTDSFTIGNPVIGDAYNFYITLTDGTYKAFVIDFQAIDIYVSNFAKFSVFGILPTNGTLTFAEAGVRAIGGNVYNDSKLGQLTLVKPFSAKITLHPA